MVFSLALLCSQLLFHSSPLPALSSSLPELLTVPLMGSMLLLPFGLLQPFSAQNPAPSSSCSLTVARQEARARADPSPAAAASLWPSSCSRLSPAGSASCFDSPRRGGGWCAWDVAFLPHHLFPARSASLGRCRTSANGC